MADTNVNRIHQPVRQASWKARSAFFLAGVALLGLLNLIVTAFGYSWGRGRLHCTGSPLSLLEVVLVPLMVFLVWRVASGWGRRPIKGVSSWLFIVVLAQLGLQLLGSMAYGSAQTRSMVSRERATLGSISRALEDYKEGHGVYPASLAALAPDSLPALPSSVFSKITPIRFVALSDEALSAGGRILWSPGPDGNSDIVEGRELEEALTKAIRGEDSAWLLDRTYDPTNGSISPGDMYLLRDGQEMHSGMHGGKAHGR